MTLGDYLMHAPWWHWMFFVLIAACLSQWRPFVLKKTTETHEHKHLHTEKDKK